MIRGNFRNFVAKAGFLAAMESGKGRVRIRGTKSADARTGLLCGAYIRYSRFYVQINFFYSTEFHDLHVIIGFIVYLFLIAFFIRINSLHFSNIYHFGFEAAA